MNTVGITVRFFAAARDLAGCERASLQIPVGSTTADVRKQLADEYPAVAALLNHSLLAINQQYAGDQTQLSNGDEVAVIPPVSGG